jgi:hypothetical protein
MILIVSINYISNDNVKNGVSNLHKSIMNSLGFDNKEHVLSPEIIFQNNQNPNEQEKDDDDEYYLNLFKIMALSKPKCDPLVYYIRGNSAIQKFQQDGVKFDKDFLNSLITLTDNDKIQLVTAYNTFAKNIKNSSLEVFGSEKHRKIEGDGIVIVGGDKFSWLALLNIHQLRRVGSNLPIEVYIPTIEDYDISFCQEILPNLNARCILGYQELPLQKINKFFNLKRYEYKLLALLTSSFENILLLDADNLVTERPDNLFSWNVYKENQLILWPDCWIRTTNPFLFEILNINIDYAVVNGNTEYDIHDLPGSIPNPSTESGMLLVNKKSHVNTLLIALYMNVYGFDYYYPLLTQGGAGEGDKDSFILAAKAALQSVYQVKQNVAYLGRNTPTGFISGGLGQCNPMSETEDYVFKNNITNASCQDFMFIHLSNPKYYPNEIMYNLVDNTGEDAVQFPALKLNYDFELQLWEILTQILCSNYTPNNIEPENIASLPLDIKFIQSATSMEYIQQMNIGQICDFELLPHLQFLRAHFHSAKKPEIVEGKKKNIGF